MNIETLSSHGYVNVTYPETLQRDVEAAMSSWQEFCNLPPETKKQLALGDRLHDIGYLLREDKGPRADNKEMFHALRKTVPLLWPKAKQVADRRAVDFITAVDALLRSSAPLVKTFAQDIEEKFNLPGFAAEVMDSQDGWTFRYLHYFGGDMLAKAHADRGGFTLHLHESHPGGEYLDLDGSWRPWPVSKKETIIFPSMGLQYRSDGMLKALWHRVTSVPETAKEGRYSMVLFIDFKMSHRYNDAVKRMQDFEPGFNYSISMPEFKKLFVPVQDSAQPGL